LRERDVTKCKTENRGSQESSHDRHESLARVCPRFHGLPPRRK
jgi:hypothetical protein